LPNGNDVSKKGLDFYHNVIDKANLLGIKIVLNIFHFDMPL
jgi:beta-glucosidase/6-phospho-beta-glucosidase/beta-galactosidase